ncbi:uncharacterized protein LTR77_003773 [Saxophila tyrrhenica]|uniref:Uncharacterized protein n=1 Tax=Saxophila tyrrhenica TaxID=1690608 RepID=A0AAV9PF87_9PEZI|nr:hypothetical protein LTR77_003773 [Saxophila tyrrhenica]
MFATSLRRRSSFAPGIHSLQSDLDLRENNIVTHDLEIPFGSTTDPRGRNTTSSRRLRVLLLAPSAIDETKLTATFERIAHFASLTGGEDVAITFLLNPPQTSNFVSAKYFAPGTKSGNTNLEGVHAYAKIQAEMLSDDSIPHIPTLPLSNLEALPALLKRHMANLSRSPLKPKPAATTFELLQLCTANPPMAQHTAFVLSDLFRDLRDLATACTAVAAEQESSSPLVPGMSSQMSGAWESSNGLSSQFVQGGSMDRLKRLRDLVGEQDCQNIVDFWREEWLLE